MTDDDLAEALANKPEPPPASGRTDFKALRAENTRRHAAAAAGARCYLNGAPRWRYTALDRLYGGAILRTRTAR